MTNNNYNYYEKYIKYVNMKNMIGGNMDLNILYSNVGVDTMINTEKTI